MFCSGSFCVVVVVATSSWTLITLSAMSSPSPSLSLSDWTPTRIMDYIHRVSFASDERVLWRLYSDMFVAKVAPRARMNGSAFRAQISCAWLLVIGCGSWNLFASQQRMLPDKRNMVANVRIFLGQRQRYCTPANALLCVNKTIRRNGSLAFGNLRTRANCSARRLLLPTNPPIAGCVCFVLFSCR